MASSWPGILRINSMAQVRRRPLGSVLPADLLHDRRVGKPPNVSLFFLPVRGEVVHGSCPLLVMVSGHHVAMSGRQYGSAVPSC